MHRGTIFMIRTFWWDCDSGGRECTSLGPEKVMKVVERFPYRIVCQFVTVNPFSVYISTAFDQPLLLSSCFILCFTRGTLIRRSIRLCWFHSHRTILFPCNPLANRDISGKNVIDTTAVDFEIESSR